jgi:LuxR family quorum sensing-dependent transcriptional regulator
MVAFCIGNPCHAKLKRPDRRWDGTWPISWELHYASQDYLSSDPLVEQMQHSPRTFRWSHVFDRADATRKRVLKDAIAFGMRDGICIPIHGPAGAVAGVSISGSDYELSPAEERALELASLYLHARLAALRAETAPQRGNLTPRERECLTWVASGKTDWEISQILNISQQTAHGYVQSALTKLGARTRAQAVALAMLSAQILQ